MNTQKDGFIQYSSTLINKQTANLTEIGFWSKYHSDVLGELVTCSNSKKKANLSLFLKFYFKGRENK